MAKEQDPFDVWRRRREAQGPSVTLIDLYRMVSEPRGLAPHELPLEERAALRDRALPILWPGYQNPPASERAQRDPIEIAPYDPAWPERYQGWHDRLEAVLGVTALRIEHVGSTAVPGLPAKPVIDIQVSVADPELESAYVPKVESLGIQLRSRDAMHRFFRPFSDLPRDVQVHVCAAGSAWERDHLLFRDYLRANTWARDTYVKAKREAAELWRDDRVAYADAKTQVIDGLMRKAEMWARATGWRPWSTPLYLALAADYDGTLADSGRVGEGTVSALRRLLACGRQFLLITGRRLDDLLSVFPEAASLAAAIVAENGALLWERQTQSVVPLASPPEPEFAAALRRQGVPVSEGTVVVASVDPYGPVIADTIRSLGLDLELALNKGAIMALPAGVHKGSGLQAAAVRLGLALHQVVGVGDAENDSSFLRLCGYAVAVGGALPAIRRQVDLCLEQPDGDGVSELINMMLAGRLPPPQARPARQSHPGL